MRLRRALPEDAPALLDLVQEGFESYRAFAPAGWEPPDHTTPEALARASNELAERETFSLVAEIGGCVAGHVTLVVARTPSVDGSLPDQHLRHLFVRPPFWGRGVAVALHDRMVQRILGTARLFTPAGQGRARRFYEREGWKLHHGPYEEPVLGLPIVEYRLRRGR